jgi:ATP-binding cassette subfamily C protein
VAHYLTDLWGYARVRLLLALLLMALVAVTEGMGLLLLVPFLQLVGVAGTGEVSIGWLSGVLGGFRPGLGLAIVAYLGLVTARALLVRQRDVVLSEIQLGFSDHLRTRLYRAIGGASWSFLARTRSARLTHVLTSDISRVGLGTHYLLQVAVLIGMALVHIVVAFSLSPAMTALALGIGGLLLLVLWPQVRRARELGEALTRDGRRVHESVSGFLGGLKLAKSYRVEQAHARSFAGLVAVMRRRMQGFVRSRATAQAIYQVGAAVTLGALVYLAVEVLQLPGAQLLVLLLVFARLLPLLSQIQRSWQSTVHMLPAYREAVELMAQCDEAAEVLRDGEPLPLAQALELRGVRFAYPGADGREVLRGVDWLIPAGSTVALMGASGAGKSTLADILLGLLVPTQGGLWVDGRLLDAEDLGRWRKSIAYVPQETFLFHDSVRSNLLWAAPEASESDLWQVLEQAAVADVVEALPQGLDTVVGERGARLSGGERQRIALARALLTRPRLLVLDEATSALDADNEARIQQAIASLHGEVTVVLIAHRQSSVAIADQVLQLDGGRIFQGGACPVQEG